MKKIFAIALALVMVLSMASAFAFVGTCGEYSWTCPTAKCGVAKAEVVQFVANNTIDQYEQSTCAAVVVGHPLYYGVKVTFDKDVNEQWFYDDATKLQIKEVANANDTKIEIGLAKLANDTASGVSGNTYWVQFSGKTPVKLVSNWNKNCVASFSALTTADSVKANVVYDFDGTTRKGTAPSVGDLVFDKTAYGYPKDMPDDEWLDYGDFKVRVHQNYGGKIQYAITIKKGGDVITAWVIGDKIKYISENSAADADALGYYTTTTSEQAITSELVKLAKEELDNAQKSYDEKVKGLAEPKAALEKAQATEAEALTKLTAAQNKLAEVSKIVGIDLSVNDMKETMVNDNNVAALRTFFGLGATATPQEIVTKINELKNSITSYQGAYDAAKQTTSDKQTAYDGAAKGLEELQRKLNKAQADYSAAMGIDMSVQAGDVKFYDVQNGSVVSGVKGYLNPTDGTAYGSTTSVNASVCSAIEAMMKLVNLQLGACVNKTVVKNIFGWSNGSASTATWNKDAVAIANAACQVAIEIPKTGDASVIAYAVMALVAAAGAMGLKK